VSAGQVREGEPLPQYGVITGTSIGALNGYLAATAQWSKLSQLWESISQQNVIRLKPEFAKIKNSSSGVGNRLAQLFALGLGANKTSKARTTASTCNRGSKTTSTSPGRSLRRSSGRSPISPSTRSNTITSFHRAWTRRG
jgi:predicted acylesterase/phospholipase RssA